MVERIYLEECQPRSPLDVNVRNLDATMVGTEMRVAALTATRKKPFHATSSDTMCGQTRQGRSVRLAPKICRGIPPDQRGPTNIKADSRNRPKNHPHHVSVWAQRRSSGQWKASAEALEEIHIVPNKADVHIVVFWLAVEPISAIPGRIGSGGHLIIWACGDTVEHVRRNTGGR